MALFSVGCINDVGAKFIALERRVSDANSNILGVLMMAGEMNFAPTMMAKTACSRDATSLHIYTRWSMKIGWIGSENDVFDGFLLEKLKK
jgi:hypothetical protein